MEIIFVIVVLWVFGYSLSKKQKRKQDALKAAEIKRREAVKQAYADALNRLAAAPSDPGLKRSALEAGRTLSELQREGGNVALFDEVALMNDINAACASSSVFAHPVRQSVETRLRTLDDLLARKIIDQSEFANRRQQILLDI